MQQTIDYLKKLTSIPSPTGFTREVADYLVEEVERLGYKPIRTNKGGVNVIVKGKDDSKHRVVTRRYIRSDGTCSKSRWSLKNG